MQVYPSGKYIPTVLSGVVHTRIEVYRNDLEMGGLGK